MTELAIRRIEDADFAAVASGQAALGRQMTAEEARERSREWERQRGGAAYAILSGAAVVGTAGISPSRHMERAASVGVTVWEGGAEEAYRLAIDVARGEGYAFATCTIAAGDDAERRVWEALGAELRDAGEGRLHPVLSL